MYVLLAVMLAELVRNACLPSATLTGLSLTPVTTPYSPANNNTFCSGIISTGGKFCVNDTAFAGPVTVQKISATQTEKALIATAALTYLTNYNNLLSVCSSTFINANLNKKINATVTITQAMLDRCWNFNSILPTVQKVVASMAVTNGDAFTKCYDFFWTASNGAFCLLATDAATNFTTVSGNTVTVTTDMTVPTRAFTPCSTLYFGACLANDVANFLDTVTGSTTASAAMSTSCGNTTVLASCVNSTSCATATQQALFTQFFKPSALTLGSSIPTTLADGIGKMQKATIARLLQTISNAVTVTTVYAAGANGYAVDTATTGLSTNSTSTNASDTNTTTTGGSGKGSNYFIAPFFMALLALLIN